MKKRQSVEDALFDVLNSEFSGAAAQPSAGNEHAPVQPVQSVQPVQTVKSVHTVQPVQPVQSIPYTQRTAPNTAKATSARRSKRASPKIYGNSCGEWIFKLFIIGILAIVLAWVIFMPDSSIEELKDYFLDQFPL